MNIYLVDFENVNSQGLNGINRLDSNDRIIIFYSENADSMTFELHEQINQSRAYIFFQKVDVGLKNALDFQLATYLGYLICENEKEDKSVTYYVVTKDRGYASLITYWSKRDVDITLVGSLTQSMKLQRERSADAKRVPVDMAKLETAELSNPQAEGTVKTETALSDAQEAAGTEGSGQTSDAAAIAGVDAVEQISSTTAGAADYVVQPQQDLETTDEPEQAESPGKSDKPEKTERRTRGRRRSKAEPAADKELRIKVEQAVSDKDVVDLVVSYIQKYKTKLGINNALAKEFKDSKKASEIYKSIKPLIADKKGQ